MQPPNPTGRPLADLSDEELEEEMFRLQREHEELMNSSGGAPTEAQKQALDDTGRRLLEVLEVPGEAYRRANVP
jgi:hypothetical protein